MTGECLARRSRWRRAVATLLVLVVTAGFPAGEAGSPGGGPDPAVAGGAGRTSGGGAAAERALGRASARAPAPASPASGAKGLAAGADGAPGSGPGWPAPLREAWLAALGRGERALELQLASRPGEGGRLLEVVRRAGGEILWYGPALGAVHARVPVRAVPAVVAAAAAAQLPGAVRVAAPNQARPTAAEAGGESRPFELRVHDANQAALGLDRLRAQTGATGKGVTVAVIDTGVDPAHPALARTPDGRAKLVDFVDLTGEGTFADRARRAREAGGDVLQKGQNPLWAAEGDVFLNRNVRLEASARVDGVELKLSGVRARAEEARAGWLDETNVGVGGTDLNGNGTNRDRLAVVAVDALPPDGYDTVYLDTDGDLDLGDERPLHVLRDGGDAVHLRARQAGGPDGSGAAGAAGASGLALAVTDVDPAGFLVNFGFDGNGHGTRMAGILGAWGGGFQGAAPGVRLLVVKALETGGAGDWAHIIAGIEYAVSRGADIIHLSAESEAPDEDLEVTERVLRSVADRGVLAVIAAGNGGPGLGTAIPLPEDAALVVGAYLPAPAASLLADPAGERLLPYSAAGPAKDGTPAPSLVGPGLTYTIVPSWQAAEWPGGLAPDEGTSVAVPYVAGTAAMLLDLARREPAAARPADLARLLQQTARSLPGVPAVAQGYGVPDAVAAWRRLAGGLPPEAGWVIHWFDRGRPYRGVFVQGAEPGVLALSVGRAGSGPARASWQGVPPWAVFPGPMPYPGKGSLQVPVRYQLPGAPGLYDAIVRLVDDRGAARGLLQAFVRPHSIGASGVAEARERVQRGRVRRVFVQVPNHVTDLSLSVSVPEEVAAAGGALSAYVYAPGGRLVRESAADLGGLIGSPETRTWTVQVPDAEPGIWEIDVFFHSATAAALEREELDFQVTAVARGVRWEPEELWLDVPGGGGRLLQTVTLTAMGRALEGQVVGFGFGAGERAADGVAEDRAQIEVPAGEPQPYRFEVAEGTALLEVRAGPSPRAGLRPRLYLYRIEQGAAVETGEPQGGGVVTVAAPPPGRYYAVVELEATDPAAVAEGGPVTVPLTVRRYADKGQIRVLAGDVRLASGQRGRIVAALDVPPGAGTYRGYLVVIDATGGVLTPLPATIRRGEPDVTVTAVAPAVGPLGAANVTVRVRDRASGSPREATLLVGGRMYTTAGGEVTLPWDGREGELIVRVLTPAGESLHRVPLPAREPAPAPAVPAAGGEGGAGGTGRAGPPAPGELVETGTAPAGDRAAKVIQQWLRWR